MCVFLRAAVRPGWRDAWHGGEDDVRPATEVDGPADFRGAEETRHPQKVRHWRWRRFCRVIKGDAAPQIFSTGAFVVY